MRSASLVRPWFAFLLLVCFARGAEARATLRPGDPAPEFRVASANGPVTLASFHDRVVLLDFWASWCAPCARSFPWMNGLSERLGDRGLTVLAVGLDHERADGRAFVERLRPRFSIAWDSAGACAERYGVTAMPTSVLIGRDGRVVAVHRGFDPRTAPEFERRIEEACAR